VGLDLRLPAVAPVADPPDPPVGAGGDVGGRQRRVARPVPVGQNGVQGTGFAMIL